MYHNEADQKILLLPKSIKVFIKALNRYALKISEQEQVPKIVEDQDYRQTIIKVLSDALKKAEDEGDTVEVILLGKKWAIIKQVTQLFLSYKEQLLRENHSIPVVLEYKEEEIEHIRELLQLLEQQGIPQRAVYLNSVY